LRSSTSLSDGESMPVQFPWKRLDYLAHRWVGIILGSLVFVWFASGIVMVFYPWPALTESRELGLLRPFEPAASVIGFNRAATTASEYLETMDTAGLRQYGPPVGARLMSGGERLIYQFWGEEDGHFVPTVVMDAISGRVLSPISPALAEQAAREMVGTAPRAESIERLEHGDHYMMNHDYASGFPAYRVRFDDPSRTSVYVSERGGTPFGVVTTRTRLTTWFGTVPHWFYFMWLYKHRPVWQAVNIATAAVGVLLALTGIVLGLIQVRRRKRDGVWRVTPYRGVSKWHHLAGLVFGVIVLTWTFSAAWENLGEGNTPREGQGGRSRGGALRWSAITLNERQAVDRLRGESTRIGEPVAIDLVQSGGKVGYTVHFANHREYWVDASTGTVRSEIPAAEARTIAQSIVGTDARAASVNRISQYDTYYYARPGREMHLPAWRIRFNDDAESTVYLDAVNGTPVGFVDLETRKARWLRDGLHSFDYPFLNDHRALWYAIVLPLLVGGLASATTGVVLLLRRMRRNRRERTRPIASAPI
jgi:uncharacterized membrane protein YkoI